MSEELKKQLNLIFSEVPKTRAALELKEELMTNSLERYQDLIENSITEEDALENVINSIGDVSQLFGSLELKEKGKDEDRQQMIKKLALYKSIAVGLYFVAFVVYLVISILGKNNYSGHTDNGLLGLIVMIVIAIIPTCILVYINSAYPGYVRKDETMVEEFKEWNSTYQNMKSIRNTILVILWLLVLCLYFIVSFATFSWDVTWIIFLIGGCVQGVIHLVFKLKELNKQ